MSPTTAQRCLPTKAWIRRPDRADHAMLIETVEATVTAKVGGRVLARSRRALSLRERFGERELGAVFYFPPEDVRAELLEPTGVETSCPLKGQAELYDLSIAPPVGRAAWNYKRVLDFDPRLTALECCVAFDPKLVTLELQPFDR